MRQLAVFERVVAVARGGEGDGVERRRVERDHRHEHGDHDDRRAGQRFDDADDHAVEVARLGVLADEVRAARDLHAHGVVAEDDEADDRGADAESVPAEDRLAHGAPAGDTADEKRRGHTPDHPVRPVVDRPVLREV